MTEFLAWAPTVSPTLIQAKREIDYTLKQATDLRQQFRNADELMQHRERSMNDIRKAAEDLSTEQQLWKESLPEDIKQLHGHIHRPLILHLMRLTSFEDIAYLQGLDGGFAITGDIPPTGQGTARLGTAGPTKSSKQLCDEARAKRNRGDVPIAKKYVQQLWDNINTERQQGRWTPWQKMSEIGCDVASHVYFGKDEGDKIRGILAPDNDTAALAEKIVPLGVDGWVELIRLARYDPHITSAELFKEDWKSGFKQFAVHPQDIKLFWAHLPHPQTGEIWVTFPRVLPFGGRGSANQFAHAPLFMVHVLRVLFGMYTGVHVDDVPGIEQQGPLAQQAHQIVVDLHQLCGHKLHDEKRVPCGAPYAAAKRGVILGIDTDLDRSHVPPNCIAKLTIPADKRERYIKRIDDAIAQGKLTAAEAGKIAGQAQYAVSALWMRSGRAFLWPLYNRAHKGDGDHLTEALLFGLQGIREIHKQCKPRCVWPVAECPTMTIILDARGTVNGEWGSEFLSGPVHLW